MIDASGTIRDVSGDSESRRLIEFGCFVVTKTRGPNMIPGVTKTIEERLGSVVLLLFREYFAERWLNFLRAMRGT